MGQYYHPIILNHNHSIKGYVHPHHFDNGLKLMEHSYINNDVVAIITLQIMNNPHKLVWAGDYADNADKYYCRCDEKRHEITKNDIVPSCEPNDVTFWGMAREKVAKCRYFINHTKKQYFDMKKLKTKVSWGDLRIHPLPILTADGNGRGGGDYSVNDDNPADKLVGTWAYNLIEASEDKPDATYVEIYPNFKE